MVMKLRAERYPRARALAACTKLLIPSKMPLVIWEVNQRRTPCQWRLIV